MSEKKTVALEAKTTTRRKFLAGATASFGAMIPTFLTPGMVFLTQSTKAAAISRLVI